MPASKAGFRVLPLWGEQSSVLRTQRNASLTLSVEKRNQKRIVFSVPWCLSGENLFRVLGVKSYHSISEASSTEASYLALLSFPRIS